MGMRFAGIEGVVVHQEDEVRSELEKAVNRDDIAVILITETLVSLCPDLIYDLKLNRKQPLIVEIPDRHGNGRTKDSITKYVQDAIKRGKALVIITISSWGPMYHFAGVPAYSVSPGPLARKKVILEDREKANVPCELAAAASARSARVKMAPPWVRCPALR